MQACKAGKAADGRTDEGNGRVSKLNKEIATTANVRPQRPMGVMADFLKKWRKEKNTSTIV